jgi:anti-sigma-K factor RskA
MTAVRRFTATLLATAAIAAASPVDPNDGNPFPTSVPQSPTSPPNTTIVNNGSPWWTFVLVATAAVAVTLLVSLLVSRLRHHDPATQIAH